MLTNKGHARRKLLVNSASSALLYYPLMRMLRDSEALAQTAAAPCAVFAYWPTGFKPGNFWPDGVSGPIAKFPAVLKPIEDLGLKDDFLLLDGLNFHGSYDHNGGLTQTFAGWGGAGLWEGAGIKYQGGAIHGSTLEAMLPRPYSLDQMLADKWKADSVCLGVASRKTVFPDPLSWKKEGAKNKAEDNPKVTFDRYFGTFMPGTGGSNEAAEAAKKVAAAEKRVIDFLRGDIKRIENNLGSEDKLAFQSHVAAIDEINAELDKAMKDPIPKEENLVCKPADLKAKFGNEAGDWFLTEDGLAKVFQLQRALIVQILACGIARVAIWQIGGGHSVTQLRSEGVGAKNADHHVLSHEGGAAFEDIQRGHIREIGKLALDLKNAKTGGKAMLDNTLFYAATDSGDTGHVPDRVPAFFLGSLGGKFKSGRQIRFAGGKGYNHALITAAHLVGATEINQIGNTRYAGPLDEILKG